MRSTQPHRYLLTQQMLLEVAQILAHLRAVWQKMAARNSPALAFPQTSTERARFVFETANYCCGVGVAAGAARAKIIGSIVVAPLPSCTTRDWLATIFCSTSVCPLGQTISSV